MSYWCPWKITWPKGIRSRWSRLFHPAGYTPVNTDDVVTDTEQDAEDSELRELRPVSDNDVFVMMSLIIIYVGDDAIDDSLCW